MTKKYLKKEKSYQNPFYQDKKRGKVSVAIKFNSKKLIFFLGAISFLGGLIYFVFFSSIFQIKNIEIVKAERTDKDELEKAVLKAGESQFLKENMFLFKNKNLNLDNLKDEFALNELSIIKKWPNTLIINIAEKESFAVWKEKENYFLVSDDGTIVKNIVSEMLGKDFIKNSSSTELLSQDIENLNNYPLIENNSESNFKIEVLSQGSGSRIQEENGRIKYIGLVYNGFIERFSNFEIGDEKLKIEKFILENNGLNFKINTNICQDEKRGEGNKAEKEPEEPEKKIDICKKGPVIYFSFTEEEKTGDFLEKQINDQLDKLVVLVKFKLKEEIKSKVYLDLRYGDKVYYR